MAVIKTIKEESLTALGDAIRAKTGKSDLLEFPTGMVEATGSIETGGGGLPEEALVISGDCRYRFSFNGWNWFIENYRDRITTENIGGAGYMFYNANTLQNIPFELNFDNDNAYATSSVGGMFYGCNKLLEIPKINNCRVSDLSTFCESCYRLRSIPEDIEDWFDWSYMESYTNSFGCSRGNTFPRCYSLRSIPMGFLNHANPNAYHSNAIYYSLCERCYTLDELVGLPVPYTATWTSNAFYNTVNSCHRLKNFTFATPDGTPYVMNWKLQTIDLSNFVGYINSYYKAYITTDYNSGITADKEVTDDATYQALKDDPDWFTCNIAYSRYNHDSAVATINSLPDTSAYLAANGGTNTIKFNGAAGSATDGGAINTLTEEEIAVATAKGWTVTLV